MDELKEKLCKNEGPKVQATQPDYAKFHDDKVALSALASSVHPLTCNPHRLHIDWQLQACFGVPDCAMFPRMQPHR